ncbi:hypothetical protein JM16_009191, partial [Phytophthora kernoviae]
MLEEGGTILEEMKVDLKHVVRVIVPFFNGFSPQPVERSMPIVASFSWRLLYRFFLDKNCDLEFTEWFAVRLPRNGGQLMLASAVKVIERKLREKLQEPAATLYLFLSVDEYQKIEGVRAPQTGSKTSVLRELVETVTILLCTQSSSMIVLPMFAGTDLGVIEPGSIANSSYYVTERLPMNLLSMDQVFSIVESDASYAGLLNHAQICRHLFILGGVPRWTVEYLTAVNLTCVQEKTVSLDSINNCFETIWGKYVESYLNALESQKLVRLAAFAVSGRRVRGYDMFDGSLKWSRLRDSSLCLLIPFEYGACDVRVPYALLHSVGLSCDEKTTEADRDFAGALKDMREEVDSAMFKVQPWQSWEMFGACFYAVRINALLVLGHSTVTLGDLLPGTLMSAKTRAISVKLVPSRVIRCAGAFGASTPRFIPRKGNQLETIDWTSGGYIVVNDDGGAGVDIFFALKDAATGNEVVIVDQRKRQFGKFQPSHASVYLDKLSVCPDFLVASGARLVRGVMNCVSSSNLATYVVPDGCFVLSRAKTEQFHGTLAYHPACSPVISMNSACKTALKTVFQGDTKEVDQVVGEIMRKREEPSGGFLTSDELLSFIKTKRSLHSCDGLVKSAERVRPPNVSGMGLRTCFASSTRWFMLVMFAAATFALVMAMVSSTRYEHLSSGLIWGGVLSAVSVSFVIISYVSVPAYRQHPNPLMFWRTIADAIFVCQLLAQQFVRCVFFDCGYLCNSSNLQCGCTTNAKAGETYIWFAGVFEFSLIAAECWFLSMTANLLLSLTNPFADFKRNTKLFHVFSWGTGLLMAVLLMTINSLAGFSDLGVCWTNAFKNMKPDTLDTCDAGFYIYDNFNSSNYNAVNANIASWVFFYVWMAFFIVFGIGVWVWAWKRLSEGMPETYAVRVQSINRARFNVFAVTIYWILVIIIYFLFLRSRQNGVNDRRLNELLNFVIAGKGYVDLVIWFSLNDFRVEDFKCMSTTITDVDVDLNPQVNAALRREVLFYTTSGIV